ncbi:hypothetical protein LOTGIDRAFT_158023 [Lottia gigantea]|uniref:Leucine-rich repeat-containing protein 28 n=1 Tax=Lottia gigantea TaxID=225164 RepID=V4CFD4_LOTGI|nr:hypothetical protein LOTGIDRAFT_158023 [Lottia gigantea]ESP00730.1 hypothetical protein LOTGIDRAFT_158023 [Lottia gigantea]
MEVVLQLNYSGLTQLSADFCQYNRHIERLYLKRNKLKTLPKDIRCFCNLIDLYLPANEIHKLPDEIGCLKNLRYLDLSSNFLKSLPASIGQLSNLEKLNLSINNFLSILPNEIGQLQKLLTFEAAYLNLKIFPKQLCDCKSLQKLCLDRNFISFIPKEIVKLKNLQDLSMCGNSLVSLSHNLMKLKNIRDIYVDQNPALFSYPYKLPVTHLGCGRIESEDNCDEFCYMDVEENGQKVKLCLGDDVTSFGHPVLRPIPQLLELCFRVLSNYSSVVLESLKDQLPKELFITLTSQTSLCTVCEGVIFVDGFVVVVIKTDPLVISDDKVMYETVLCCSKSCVETFINDLPSHYRLIYPKLLEIT